MSKILTTALLATSAAAQLTTSLWIPGAANSNVSFVASVIEASGDQTTLSLDFAGGPMTDDEYYSESPHTVTVAGDTSVGFEVTAEQPYGQTEVAFTIALACTRTDTDAIATCTMTTKGADQVISAICVDAKKSHATPLEGEQYCTDSEGVTTEQTLTLTGDSAAFMNNFPMTITAGTEKLDASAVATPSGSGARSTGAAAAASAGTGSVRPSNTPSVSRSGSAAEQSTAGAAPMMTLAPLAGLGAAAAAFFL